MFAWLARGIPIGNRLWLALVIIFLIALVAPPGWFVYFQHPLDHGVQIFVLLGQILVVDCCISLGFVYLVDTAEVIGRRLDNRRRKDSFVDIEYQPSLKGCIEPFVGAWIFVIAVFLAPRLGLPQQVAAVGWFILLFTELLEVSQGLHTQKYQYLEVELKEDVGPVFMALQKGKKRLEDSMQTDWPGAIAYLTRNEWDLVETHQIDVKEGRKTIWKRTALFRRTDDRTGVYAGWNGDELQILAGWPGKVKGVLTRWPRNVQESLTGWLEKVKEFLLSSK